MRRRVVALVAMLVAFLLAGTACTSAELREAGDNAEKEQTVANQSLGRMLDAQPPPSFDWSQERQTVIDVQNIRALGATTTTLFTLNGVGVLLWCPSIGAPVPATTQLTNPEQVISIGGEGGRTRHEVPLMEQTGTYTGETTATWTVCLDDNGKKFGVMWEANVGSVSGVLDVSKVFPDARRVQPNDITYEFVTE